MQCKQHSYRNCHFLERIRASTIDMDLDQAASLINDDSGLFTLSDHRFLICQTRITILVL